MKARFPLAHLKTRLFLKPDLGSLNDAQLDTLEKRWSWIQRLLKIPLAGGLLTPLIGAFGIKLGFVGFTTGHPAFLFLLILVAPSLLIPSILLDSAFENRRAKIKRVSEITPPERAECVALIKSNPKARAMKETALAQGRSLRFFDFTQMRELEAHRQELKANKEFARLMNAAPLGTKAAAISEMDTSERVERVALIK